MPLPRELEDRPPGEADFNYEEESSDSLSRKRALRREIEDRLERKRLREELEEDFDEFDWDDFEP